VTVRQPSVSGHGHFGVFRAFIRWRFLVLLVLTVAYPSCVLFTRGLSLPPPTCAIDWDRPYSGTSSSPFFLSPLSMWHFLLGQEVSRAVHCPNLGRSAVPLVPFVPLPILRRIGYFNFLRFSPFIFFHLLEYRPPTPPTPRGVTLPLLYPRCDSFHFFTATVRP